MANLCYSGIAQTSASLSDSANAKTADKAKNSVAASSSDDSQQCVIRHQPWFCVCVLRSLHT